MGYRPTFSGLSLSSSSRVEEAADVGEQGCNAKDSDSDNVRVRSHVAQSAVCTTSCLHLNCWRAEGLACRWSCAHEAKHRRAAKGQHQEGGQRAGAGHCKSWGKAGTGTGAGATSNNCRQLNLKMAAERTRLQQLRLPCCRTG